MNRVIGLVAAVAVVGLAAPVESASAAPVVYDVVLDGLSESPSNASPGHGLATIVIDTTAHTLEVHVTFSGLLGSTTASHIHAPTSVPLDITKTAGVATQVPTFVDFPLGVTAGTYDHLFDLTMASSYNPAYVTANGGTPAGAEAALAAAMAAGRAYLNIHTAVFPGGEIRGFLRSAETVPEPTTVGLAALGAIGLVLSRRRLARTT